MNQVKFLQPLDTMERISRAELGSNLDELLEKIDKEDVGKLIRRIRKQGAAPESYPLAPFLTVGFTAAYFMI